jgi:ribosomal protein S12 methylthiotransferase
MKTKLKNKKVNIVTLGCSKNLVDSEQLARQLDANNLQVHYDSNSSDAKNVIINTCGFIKDAKEESVDTILQFAKAKEEGDIENLFVMGCLSERYKKDLETEIPEVDKYFGTNDIKNIIESLGGNLKSNLLGERFQSTPSHFSYLKISEGCDRTCSFCAIPLMRGKHKSKSIENIIEETENLVKQGSKEIILIAQDLTYYGIDLYKENKLSYLLQKLTEVDGLEWLRLHYAYPTGFPRDIIKVIKENDKICNYLDLPFQHVSDNVLKKMRRGISKKQTYELIDFFRSEHPDLSLRTTLMVGHPGEDEQSFDDLVKFVEEVKFNRLGVFTYSEEEDTYGARNFPDEISEEVKTDRLEKIMSLQQSISRDKNESLVGQQVKVIIDREEGDYFVGRTEFDSPEVDNEVLIRSNSDLKIGNFYNVKITGAEDFDLFAEQ